MELAGRTVLITGASTGIGAAAARAVAARDGHALLVARSADRLQDLATEIERSGGRASAFPADVGDLDAVAAMADRVRDEVGTPEVIVNNAGAGRFLFIDETDPRELTAMTAVPYHAAFYVTRAFIEDMIARGGGRIVNICTPVAYFPWPGAAGYAGARWAVRGFTEALRADLHGTGVGVSLVVPGKVSSDYFVNNPGAEERLPGVEKLLRSLTPDQAADAIVDAIERERSEVFVPFELRLLELQGRLFPGLTRWIVQRTGARRPG
jgi:short-subunit dehydrogenase